MQRLLYDKKGAAFQLSLSVRTIEYLLAQGVLQFRRVGTKVLIPHSELVKFAKADHFGPVESQVVGNRGGDKARRG